VASYPTAVFAPSVRSAGQTIQPGHINDLQDEVAALTTALLKSETTFSPTLGGTGGQSGQVYASQVGLYTKIGNRVDFDVRITMTTVGTLTGNVVIGNLPYTAVGTSGYIAGTSECYWEGMGTAFYSLSGYISAGTNYIVLAGITAAAVTKATLVQANFADGCTLVVSGSYKAA
jgi:hypothetical protein